VGVGAIATWHLREQARVPVEPVPFALCACAAGLVYFLACVPAFWGLGYGADGGRLLLIALFVLLEDADATLANVLIAKKRVRYHVLSTAVAYAVLVVAFALYYRLLGPSLWVLILAQVTKTVALVGVSLGLVHFRIERLRPTVPWREVANLARASLPFLLIALAAVSYRHILNFWLSGLGRLDLAADFGLALFVVNGLMFFTYINNSLLYPRVCREPSHGLPRGVCGCDAAVDGSGVRERDVRRHLVRVLVRHDECVARVLRGACEIKGIPLSEHHRLFRRNHSVDQPQTQHEHHGDRSMA